MSFPDRNLNKQISIEYPLFQSKKGRYYIGETPILKCLDNHAIAVLTNPTDSNINIYLNAITVTNISGQNFSAEIYLRSTSPEGIPSSYVSCTNISIVPPPQPSGKIQFNDIILTPPADGVAIFSRIIPSFSTTVMDGGQIIIPPESCILVYIGGYLPIAFDGSAIVAFGWWEEPRNKHCYNPNQCCN